MRRTHFRAFLVFLLSAAPWCVAQGERVWEITLPDPSMVQSLIDQGLDISHVHGNAITAHGPEEVIAALGLPYREIVITVPGRATKAGVVPLGQYHLHADLEPFLQPYVEAYPEICRLVSLGDSTQGRALWAMLITDNPDTEEDEPEFKYVSTMHGNEPVGVELCLYFIDHLLTQYGQDERITWLVDETAIWIVPLMNPDGREVSQRGNARGMDLNRNFPAYPANYTGTIFDGESLGEAGREAETQIIMQWSAQNSFVLSANMHTGALLVNYPYDNEPGVFSGQDAPTPDDSLVRVISLAYSAHNPPMFNSPVFSQGISNGSAWFSILGGMQDWHYRYLGCVDVTLELSNMFIPSESALPLLWEQNRESMLSYLERVHFGARGAVTDLFTGAPLWAKVTVDNNPQPVFTDPDVGDYHRMLLAGTYALTFVADGYFDHTAVDTIVVPESSTRRDARLIPRSADFDGNGQVGAMEVQIVINAALDLDVGGAGADLNGDGLVTSVDVQLMILAALQ